jgi:hypothetical protein
MGRNKERSLVASLARDDNESQKQEQSQKLKKENENEKAVLGASLRKATAVTFLLGKFC